MCESDVDRYGIILDNTFVSTVTHNTDTKTKMLGARYSRKQMQPTIFPEAKRVVRQNFFFSFTFFLSLSLFHTDTQNTNYGFHDLRKCPKNWFSVRCVILIANHFVIDKPTWIVFGDDMFRLLSVLVQ